MKNLILCLVAITQISVSCTGDENMDGDSIKGFELLNDINGHWVGTNQTAFGFYDWFAFDFRPISQSHSHSIYEGGTNQNIITSIFIADFEGKQQIMARNGGWLGSQYRATYFVLDREEKDSDQNYYRLVDAVGGEDRSYIEFRFTRDSIYIDAFKDNSGSLDKPVHHMGFAGANRNPSYAENAKQLFDYPQRNSEIDLNGKFANLIDPDSALFLEENSDPFPKTAHGHVSDLNIEISRNLETEDNSLLLFISKEGIINSDGTVNIFNLDNSVIRTISVQSEEDEYSTSYLHPDNYYITVFADMDGNSFPSPGDYTSMSKLKNVNLESLESVEVSIGHKIE